MNKLFIIRARRVIADGSVACFFAIHGGRMGIVNTSGGLPKWMFDRMGGMCGNFGIIAQTYNEKNAENTAYLMRKQGFTTVEILPVADVAIVSGVVNAKPFMVWE